MLTSPTTSACLVGFTALATAAIGVACRRRETWAAPLLLTAPLALAWVASDFAWAWASAHGWCGGPTPGRVLLGMVVTMIPAELLTQGVSSRIAGAGIRRS